MTQCARPSFKNGANQSVKLKGDKQDRGMRVRTACGSLATIFKFKGDGYTYRIHQTRDDILRPVNTQLTI